MKYKARIKVLSNDLFVYGVQVKRFLFWRTVDKADRLSEAIVMKQQLEKSIDDGVVV